MSSPPPIVVVGAGGHGKVVADILLASGAAVAGFLDDGKPVGTKVMGLEVLGGNAWLGHHVASVALGIGDNLARARVAELVLGHGSRLLRAVHPRAVVSPHAALGEGTVVMALAVVNPDATIARGAILNTGCIVEHDCKIGAFAHVSPNAAMAGGCALGDFSQLGVGASMLPGTSVGHRSTVGGGALVRHDIPPHSIAYGVPARVARTQQPPP